MATYEEIENHWSIFDLEDANEILDLKEDAENRAHRQAKAKRK